MAATPLTDVAARLSQYVKDESGDMADDVMRLPVSSYRDEEQYQKEIEQIFHKVPLVACMSIDIPKAGDYTAWSIAERPIITMRGEDGVARSFLNVCRHRGALLTCEGFGHGRRLSCPYHAWVYDAQGALVSVPGKEQFGTVDVSGLIELPTAERAGLVFSVLTPGAPMDIDEWLGDMAQALEYLGFDELHRFETTTNLESGNWKTTADGYLDGYHVGYLHKNNIGKRTWSNRNTWDLYGPHVRIGFANRPIAEMDGDPAEWDLTQAMSLVHYLFPNISISGQPGRRIMMSRLAPGPTVGECTVTQYHYSRVPIESDEQKAELEATRVLYAAVTGDEDFATVVGINQALPAIADDVFLFGKNEPGNQNLHNWVAKLTSDVKV
jgi:phenylpropionate dioxygenase-like ring-hydroxylating dioxygenase large terminal subunit